MCFGVAAVIPAVIGAASSAAATAATAAGVGGTFLGLSAGAWTGLGITSGLAGTVLQGIGQYQQGKQQQQDYKYNARIQEQQALDAEQRGSMAQGQANLRTRAIVGAVHAGQGSSGVIAGDGTGEDVLTEIADIGARDAAQLRINAAREAWGLRAGAAIDRQQGQMAASAGRAKAGATFLKGINIFASDPWWKTVWGS